jgi:hypothetical protein
MPNFDEIELLLLQLLRVARPVFSDAGQTAVQRFIDVGEYGLALETVVAVYREEEKVMTGEAMALIENLALAMDMSPMPLDGITKTF